MISLLWEFLYHYSFIHLVCGNLIHNLKWKSKRKIIKLKNNKIKIKIRNYEKENIKKEREGWTSRKGKRRIRSPNKRSRFDNNSLVVDSKSFFEFWNPCPSFSWVPIINTRLQLARLYLCYFYYDNQPLILHNGVLN